MVAARLLRGTRRYFTLRRLILSTVLGMLSFIVYTTFSRGNEHLMTRSDLVHSLGNFSRPLSTERLQRCAGKRRGKEPNVLRFEFSYCFQRAR